jgi:EmrB/QacA subfamily drug resistance transporter
LSILMQSMARVSRHHMASVSCSIKRNLGLAGICIASFLGCIDLTVVNTILPAVSRGFSIPIQNAQWVTSIFMVALSAFMVPVGTLADSFGRKRFLIIGLILFGAASFFAGVANQFWVLVFFRFVQGIGCAILYTVSGAIVSYTFEEGQQGKALGILFGANGIGLAIGPIVGGLFAGALDWHDAFLINIPFILISLFLCTWAIPEFRGDEKKRLDVTGCLLLIAVLMSFVSYLSMEGGRFHWCLLLASLGGLVLFIWHEMRVQDPIVEFHFFREARFLSALLATFVLAFYYCIVLLTIPIFFSSQLQKSDVSIGLLLLPATITFSITSSWIGSRSERIGPSRIIMTGLILFAAASMLLAFAAVKLDERWFIAPLILFGIGWGAILGPSTLIALSSLPRNKAAVAMGTSWTVHNVGGASGIAFAVFLMRRADSFQDGYCVLMLVLAVVVVAASLMYQTLSRRGDVVVAK